MQYVALLRGINVGKSVQVPMKDLKSLFEKLGFTEVSTYLNSGNVIFKSDKDIVDVSNEIEGILVCCNIQTT
jgi:uncharacterized protein (DUF1697 family)